MNRENIKIEKTDNGFKTTFSFDDYEIKRTDDFLLEQIEEINKLRITNKEELQIRDLLNRIDKSIEYIESYLPNYDFDKTNLGELLNILKGGNNDK